MADQVTELRQRIHKEGYDTRTSLDGHIEVIDPDGNVVRHKSGKPLRFPSTPSDTRGMKNAVAQLRDAGVLPRPARGRRRDNGRGEAQHIPRTVLKQYSDALREEVKTLMVEHDLTQANIYHFADRWAATHGIPVPSFPQGVMSKFLKGGSLNNANYRYFTAAVSAIRRNEGKIPDIPYVTTTEGEPGASIEVVAEEPTRLPTKLPTLAFDAMQMIYKEEKDHDAIMALVLEIAKLEQ